MMKGRLLMAGALLVGVSMRADAQCASSNPASTQDACQKALDLVNFITPQLSTALAGGNATLGQGGTLAGWGHVAFDVRGTVVNGTRPEFSGVGFGVNGPLASTYASKAQMIPGATIDAAIGIWRGYSVGVTHVGGIDALVSATYLPNVNQSSVSVQASGGNIKLAYGVRLGILEEGLLTPGVAISYLQRDLPTVTLTGTANGSTSLGTASGTVTLSDLSVQTSGWRLTASKSVLLFGLVAGVGQDTYKSSSNLNVTVTPTGFPAQSGSGTSSLSMTRTNMFLSASVNVLVAKLVGEIGQVSGGSLAPLYNNLGEAADKSRTYMTLGLRIGL